MKGKPMTPEQKAKMAAGRERARAAKTAESSVSAAPPAIAPHDTAAAEERRQRLLGLLDPESASLISDAELAQIEAEERERARGEARKQALADVRAAARQRARVEMDLIPASQIRDEAERARMMEPVTFEVSLPSDGAGHRGQNGFRVDGKLYQAGRRYTVPRHVFESLAANHYRTWLNEIEFVTLDQHKPGKSAREILHRTVPRFEVAA